MAGKTYGQVAFEAYIDKRNEGVEQTLVTWEGLNDHLRQAWEEGACAVLVALAHGNEQTG